MIKWFWLIPTLMIGASIGLVVSSLLTMAKLNRNYPHNVNYFEGIDGEED